MFNSSDRSRSGLSRENSTRQTHIGRPPHLLEVAIEAKNPADLGNLLDVLRTLASEDDLFRVAFDQESGQVILKGMDERHLDDKIDALHRSGGFEVYLGAPQIAYLETMTLRVEEDVTQDGQVGGQVQFARVRMVFEPNKTAADRAFVSKIDDDSFPEQYLSGIESGIRSVMRAGVLAGFPVVDVAVTLIDGAFRDGASSPLAFEIAARTAFRQALQQGRSILLEPIMRVDVVTPREFFGAVIGDLRSRRGRIQDESVGRNVAGVTAIVPLSNMFGYQNQLASFSLGRGTFTMAFASYAPTPLRLMIARRPLPPLPYEPDSERMAAPQPALSAQTPKSRGSSATAVSRSDQDAGR